MASKERRWAVIALVEGTQSMHSWISRAADPTDDEVERAAATLRGRGIPAWLAVTEGEYWSDEPMTTVAVRQLSGEGDFGAAWDAFLAARAERLRSLR